MEVPVMVTGKSPVLLYVTWFVEPVFKGCVPKVNEEGEAVACKSWPVPDKFTAGDGPGKLPETERVPVSAPRAVGVKVTLTEQLAPAASEPTQLFACAKSPVRLTADSVYVAWPELVIVTVWAAVVEPIIMAPKFNDAGAPKMT